MRILIEEYKYDINKVKDVLYGIDAMENLEGRVSIHYVGYYYNSLLKDCVFILPKVLLKDVEGVEKVFGKYMPEAITNLDKENPLDSKEKDFIYKFAVWIYRAIVVYKNSKAYDSDIVIHSKIAEIGKGRRRLSNTYLDILLQLIQFNRDNQSFFFFIVKNLHSGMNKINWTRTISKEKAIVQNNSPIYLKPINKKRQINFDEELLIIFFSILNYISDTYGFPKEIKCQFELIKGNQFKTYLNGYGCTRLRQIKYKYFSDKALELWELCYAFFDEARQVFINTEKKEYLVVRNFYTVFEAIIDELVGDNPLPDGMDKVQEDGKIVDHLYTAKSLIESENTPTYYIGDSKYYKIGHDIGPESIYKQYTYARNVIQWNLDIFNDGREPESGVKLRDDVTEGYNIIPNFFISAKMDEDLSYTNDGIEKTDRKKNKHRKTHFKNRLFDRDTLLLFHYDVNFLFVISLYARNNASQKEAWKKSLRDKFRKEIQDWLNQDYDFYALRARPRVNAEQYFKTHFQDVLGKTYTPFADQHIYSLALDKKDPDGDNSTLISELRNYFFVEPCGLGNDPEPIIACAIGKEGVERIPIEVSMEDYILVGCYRSLLHKEWVKKNGKYNIRLNMGYDIIDGAVKPSPLFMNVKHVLLYNEEDLFVSRYYDITKTESGMPEVYGFEKLKELFYPFNIDRFPLDTYEKRVKDTYGLRAYLIYAFNREPISFLNGGMVDLAKLFNDYIKENTSMGTPFVITMKDLVKYIN